MNSSSFELIRDITAGRRPDADRVSIDTLIDGADRPSNIMPFVIESDGRRERAYDIYSLLLKERIVFLGTPIDAMIANIIIAQLLYLAREDDKPLGFDLLLTVGDRDQLGLFPQTTHLHEVLLEHNKQHEWYVQKGVGHGTVEDPHLMDWLNEEAGR